MNTQDRKIVEEIRTYLGLDAHDRDDEQRLALGTQHVRSYIDDMFGLKAAKMDHHDAVLTAFVKTHHNMYLDDPAFATTFKKEMTARGIPKPEIEKALDEADKVLDLVYKEFGSKQEKDGGIHPKWNDIVEISQPGQPDNAELIKPRDGHSQKSNIKSDLPINRKGKPARQKPVMESTFRKGNSSRTGIYKDGFDIEIPQGDIYVEVELEYEAIPHRRATYDSPEEGGNINIYNTKITKIEPYDNLQITPDLQAFIQRDVEEKSNNGYFSEKIGEHLYEQEQANQSEYYDQKRRAMQEEL